MVAKRAKAAKSKPRICFDRPPKDERQLVMWAAQAIEIDPRNRPPHETVARAALVSAVCMAGSCDSRLVEAPPLTPADMAGLTTKFWKAGQEVTFGFLRATAQIAAHARNAFAEIAKHANIKFRETSASSAIIRIADDEQGSWSYLGVDALGIPKSQQTMNLARSWADLGTATHEVCHACGMVHEHQSPAAPENLWNEDAVYRYYSGPPNNWSRAQIKGNVLDRYSSDQTQFTEWDRKSIMLYPLDKALLRDPKYATGWNRELSLADQAFLGQMYPFPKSPDDQDEIVLRFEKGKRLPDFECLVRRP